MITFLVETFSLHEQQIQILLEAQATHDDPTGCFFANHLLLDEYHQCF